MAKKTQKSSPGDAAGNRVDLPEVERVLEFMQRHGLEEFEYERDSFHIRLRKPSQVQSISHAPAAPISFAPSPAVSAEAPRAAAASPAFGGGSTAGTETAAGESANLHIVKSPIVGTFYASPSPDAPPFVTIGANIETGQPLCIIEAMKLMNEIEADAAGELAKIFVENGQPVEYGEALFGIRPNRKK
jgi:acetyl-CoA carboxylase biotin carboxyl carrier protein